MKISYLENLGFHITTDGSIQTTHRNGKVLYYTIDDVESEEDLRIEISSNDWIKNRLVHFNQHGTIKGY